MMKRLRWSSEQLQNLPDAEYRTIMIWLNARLKRLLPDLEAEIDHVMQTKRRGREAEMAEIIENSSQRELLKRGLFDLVTIAEMPGLTVAEVEASRDFGDQSP